MLRRVDQDTSHVTAQGLRVTGLCKRYGPTPVLAGIDLAVAHGELIAVLGPSGSGKTTLLRLVCGFERADCGRITLGERVVTDGRLHLPPEQRGVGYVAQEGALFPHLSVAENLLFALPRHVRKARGADKARRIGELLELVDLPAAYAQRRPAALSGGEQQRVALARALAPQPAIVLLDEPFSALDAGLRAEVRAAIASSLKRAHATALLVTHDQDEALSMGDRVAVLQGGRFAQVATPQALYRFPASRAIAGFVGEAVLVPGTAAAGTVTCRFGRLPMAAEATAPADGPVEVMLRPEQLRLAGSTAPERTADGAQILAARVDQVEFHGHDAKLTLRLADGLAFTATVPGFDMPSPGQEVGIRVVGSVVAYAATRQQQLAPPSQADRQARP